MSDHSEDNFRKLTWEELQQPYVDGEFAVEEPPHIHDRPEWQVWAFFGEHKFIEATRHLQFIEERDGLYHYRDLRDGSKYTLPNFDRVKEHFKDKRLSDVVNASALKGWKMAWGFWVVTEVILFWVAVSLDSSRYHDHHQAVESLGTIFMILLLAVAPVMILIQLGSKRRPRPLPPHTMWFTDQELEDMRRRQMAEEAFAAVVVAGYAAHEYHKHSQKRLAHFIAEDLRGDGWHHRY